MKSKFFLEYAEYLSSRSTSAMRNIPTVSTPFTYCHRLKLLSALILLVVSFPFGLSNFSPVLLFTKVKLVDLIILSATFRTTSSVFVFDWPNIMRGTKEKKTEAILKRLMSFEMFEFEEI